MATVERRITRVQNGVQFKDDSKSSKTNGHTTTGLNPADQPKPIERETWIQSFINRILMPVFLMIFSPNLVIFIWYTAAKCDGSILELKRRLLANGIVSGIQNVWSDISIGSEIAVYIILGYMAFAAVLQLTLPGPRAEGPLTPKGNIPVYKDNGFFCYIVTLISFFGLTYCLKQYGLSPTIIYDRFDEFIGTMTVYSVVLCGFLYLKGIFYPSTTDCGSSGNPLFDFYWGTELYPRVFGVDIKVFTNCRFGMTVWPLLCLIFAIKSYELHGFVDSMWVSCILQLIYFTKFFWWEAGYMRTIDIMVDRAGYYICWGCLVYIPGLYASVSMYLVNQPVKLGPYLSIFFIVMGTLSIIINFWADQQKQEVRNTNGECKIWGQKAKIIRAKYYLENGQEKESILLVSGFWGVARHFHYVPELMLTFFWSIPALFHNILAYFYFFWLVILLTHRTFRDDTKCSQKYGKYWDEYRKKVPYKMIPGIF